MYNTGFFNFYAPISVYNSNFNGLSEENGYENTNCYAIIFRRDAKTKYFKIVLKNIQLTA